ncbi:MAG: glycoside hydrolase family 16 protein [Chitinophagaceae bacterium]|nr:MAG: glycoside hydrolase family 16 protein [Chitinophagaceae bacterium]
MKSILIKSSTLICILFVTGCSPGKPIINPETADGYKLVWADEFNTDGRPDILSWRFEKGFVRNEEAQWYQEDNAWCEKGKLIIEARREDRLNPLFRADGNSWRSKRQKINYTSSSINTAGKRSWLYGRFVMRGKINTSAGLWPAWWTLGTAGNWPANGEIDIMEYYRKMILANVAFMGQNGKPEWFTVTKPVDSLGEKWASDFHTWRMDWDQNRISLYVDDVLLNQVALERLVNKDGTGINPFKAPHYMLLNLAVGGMNGGNPGSTRFPNRFEVDYVRVYQK